MSSRFNVVYEYTEEAGLYCGNRFWTSYADKASYDQKEALEDAAHPELRVVATGMSDEEAIRMSADVEGTTRFNACIGEAVKYELPFVDGKPQLLVEVLKVHLGNHGLDISEEGVAILSKSFHIVRSPEIDEEEPSPSVSPA